MIGSLNRVLGLCGLVILLMGLLLPIADVVMLNYTRKKGGGKLEGVRYLNKEPFKGFR